MAGTLSRTLRAAAPLSLAQISFAANTFVTQFFLSRHSTTALHASIPGSMLAITYMAFFNATLGYSGTIFARRDGAGDRHGAMSTFVQSVWLTLFAMPLLALGMPLARLVLGAFNTAPEILAAELLYFDVLMANAAFTILAQVLGGFFTGQGKTAFIGIVTVFGAIVNMVIAPAFIAGFAGLPDGIAGAGVAQTIAHVVPCIILAVAILRNPVFRQRTVSLRPSLSANETTDILMMGLPSGFRTVLEIGGFFVFTALIAECSPAAVAASTTIFAINGIPYSCIQGLASAVEMLVGRSSGCAGRNDIRGVLSVAAATTVTLAAFYSLVLWLFKTELMEMFLPEVPTFEVGEYFRTATLLVAIVAAKSIFEMGTLVLQGAVRGLGDTAATFRIQMIVSFAVWMPAYFAVKFLQPSVPMYWATMILAGFASTVLLVGNLARQRVSPFRTRPRHWRQLRHCRQFYPK